MLGENTKNARAAHRQKSAAFRPARSLLFDWLRIRRRLRKIERVLEFESRGEIQMKFSTSRAVGAATLRIEGELDAVNTSDLGPRVEALVQSRMVADTSGSRLMKSLDLGMGAVVFLYKKSKEGGGAMTVQGLCDQPLAIVNLLRMEDESSGSRQVRHLARGYLHLAVKKAQSQVTPVAGRLLNAQNLPLNR
jgi:hypothetical protein